MQTNDLQGEQLIYLMKLLALNIKISFLFFVGKRVRVDLTVRHSSNKATASFYFTVNTPPRNGHCQVTPTQGVALNTIFTFNCYNWIDDHQPIAYSFWYMTSEDVHIVLYKGLQSNFSEVLSPGNRNISIDIMDHYGAYSTTYVLVKV